MLVVAAFLLQMIKRMTLHFGNFVQFWVSATVRALCHVNMHFVCLFKKSEEGVSQW